MSCYLMSTSETQITIPKYVDVNGVTIYEIVINVGRISWLVRHRYNDFLDLHQKLVSSRSISKDLLPPKKVIGNRNAQFLEQRRLGLEKYLQEVLAYLQLTMPKEFVEFLEFSKYDIIFLLQDLAQSLFVHGDLHLAVHKDFNFTVLELYAISERMKLPCPITETLEGSTDFSHILDFCSQLDTLTITYFRKSKEPVEPISFKIGASNITANTLHFDLRAFKNLKNLILDGVSPDNIASAEEVNASLTHLDVHRTSMQRLNQMFMCDWIHKEDVSFKSVRVWKNLEHINVSNNNINSIDKSICLAPNVKYLKLDRNRLTGIAHLNTLTYLTTLSVCENLISECKDWHLELGNVVRLHLSQNRLRSLAGFRKMFSLVELNVSCNFLDDLEEVAHISQLPCLENLVLTGNPIAGAVDYRARVLSHFGDRCSEIVLDNERGSQMELDMALVLCALRISAK